MLELSPRRTANPQARVAGGTQQSRRLLLALVLLLAALASVLIKDRQFWFGSPSNIIDDVPAGSTAAAPVQSAPVPKPSSPVRAATKHVATVTAKVERKSEEAPAVTTTRTALAPLDVEVVAGDKHRRVRPGSNSAKLEITNPAAAAPTIQAPTNAAQHQSISEVNEPSYPPLAQHMNVQGSVVLQAVIGSDGTIENLRVMSGPAILATAAQQAVREWHFKPIVQNGQAVESKATITVNFTIRVADNSANATIAESLPERTLILTR
ncbi:MAG TPA: TonB family protein [Candidatus Sulfotelmatobacter sp.]|nr:TonB family protein [Candidatus Sulfotelmatobacter sp.]